MTEIATLGSGLAFDELAGSPTISQDRSTRRITRTGLIAWSNIDAFLFECFPVGSFLPGRHPTATSLFVNSVNIEPHHPNPVPTSGTVVTYSQADGKEAKVTIEYTPIDLDESLIRRTWSISAEFMTLPAAGVRWSDQAAGEHVESEDIRAGKLIPTIEHNITRMNAESIPWTAIRENIGKVNENEYENAAAETLMFIGAEIDFTYNVNGDQEWTLSYHFTEKIVTQGEDTYGWNHFYRASDKTWLKLLDDDDGPIYPLSDTFANLFA